MKIRRRTEVTVRTHQVTTVRPLRQPFLAWCEACAARVPMVAPEGAVEMARTSTREVYRRIESGKLHFVETATGDLFICCPSLRKSAPVTRGSEPRP